MSGKTISANSGDIIYIQQNNSNQIQYNINNTSWINIQTTDYPITINKLSYFIIIFTINISPNLYIFFDS